MTDYPTVSPAPHSLEAEQAVLGAVLIDEDAWPAVSHLTAAEFYQADHRAIYAALAVLREEGAAVDPVTVAEQLDRDGQLEAAGGLAYLADLTENTPSAANAGSYAGIVRDHGARRRVMALANDVASYARQSKSELSGIHSLAARLVGEVEGIGEPEPRLPGETWEAKEPPPREWIIRDLLPAGRLAALYGSGASGKSMMALQWAAAIMHGGAPLRAAGAGAGGEDARRKLKADFAALQPLAESAHGRVLWLTWEDETAELIRRWRMAYHAKAIGEPFPDPDRLTLVNMRKLGGALWAPKAGGHVSTRATWTPAGERFLRSLEGHKLAVIDPLAAAFASSEIDRALVRAFTSAIDGEAESTRCAVLLIAHPSQSGAGKGGGGYSGSTDWQASVRAHLVLEASDNTAHTVGPKSDNKAPAYRLRTAKQSYAPDGGHLWLVRHWRRGDLKYPSELAWFVARAGEAAEAFEANETRRAGRKVPRSIKQKVGEPAGASGKAVDGPYQPGEVA